MSDRLDTSASARLAERLRLSMPGGDTRTGTYYEPYPIALVRGEGFSVWDADGNQYLDLLNNNTSLVHGHAHPQIVDAVARHAALGTAFPAPHPLQAELAERLRARFACVEHVRFTHSGSEAVMMAARAARAFTGRDEIVKVRGAYHGCWDQVPSTVHGEPGVAAAIADLVHEVALGDVDALTELFDTRGERIAAMMIDPLGPGFGGPATFFQTARALTSKAGSLLIFDEVVSARLAFAGWQAVVDVQPDLTALGKVIGGGLPVGAVGGRADVMAVFDPRREHVLMHSGTYNGNPLAMAAGCVSLDLLTREEIARINDLGALLAEGVRAALIEAGVPGDVIQTGSLVAVDSEMDLLGELHRAGLEEGIYFSHRGLLNISTPMDEQVVNDGLARFAKAAARVARAAVPSGS